MGDVVALNETKDWLGVTDTSDDVVIDALIDRAEQWVEEQTGRFFGATGTTHTELFSGTGTDTLWLQEDADSITSVEVRDHPGDDWETINATDDDGWEQDDEDGVKLRRKGGGNWLKGHEYRVKYTFGYGTAPEDIRQLVFDLVKMKYEERTVNLAVSREATMSHSYSRRPFTGEVKNISWVEETLERWRWRQVR